MWVFPNMCVRVCPCVSVPVRGDWGPRLPNPARTSDTPASTPQAWPDQDTRNMHEQVQRFLRLIAEPQHAEDKMDVHVCVAHCTAQRGAVTANHGTDHNEGRRGEVRASEVAQGTCRTRDAKQCQAGIQAFLAKISQDSFAGQASPTTIHTGT